MPIPPFDLNSVLPPHLGNPTKLEQVSPYRTTTVELVQRFATSPERVKILSGLLGLRKALRDRGMIEGFQLLDGSFLEDVEKAESRAPNDIDVATFFWNLSQDQISALINAVPDIRNHDQVKTHFLVDHYLVNASAAPNIVVEMSQYWYGLFSHRRDNLWKGMLRIELNTPEDDLKAGAYLSEPKSVNP